MLSSVQKATLAVKCQVSCWFLLVSHSNSSPSLQRMSHVSIGLSAISSLFVAVNNEYSVRAEDIIWRKITNYGVQTLQTGTPLLYSTWLAPPALYMSHSLHICHCNAVKPSWCLPVLWKSQQTHVQWIRSGLDFIMLSLFRFSLLIRKRLTHDVQDWEFGWGSNHWQQK